MARNHQWLDALTDGQMLRDWLGLAAPMFLGIMHWFLVIGGISLSISLVPILIGIPLLLFTLAGIRALAALDHQMMMALLNEPQPDLANDVDTEGANLGERLGLYLGSGQTWRSLIYLALTLPLGTITFSVALMLLPIIFIELLILAPLTIDMHLISVRLLHFLATGNHRLMGMLLPKRSGKGERNTSRLETVYEYEEPRYYLDDDGEIVAVKAKRGL
ncbi:MAG: sensor domain-containing protein [Anaerolineae bacterium]|nr:sensor domain-containing protein [Anaerolineae bacterium]